MKMKDGKISNKEEAEHGSLLSRKILMTIRAAVEEGGGGQGQTDPTRFMLDTRCQYQQTGSQSETLLTLLGTQH